MSFSSLPIDLYDEITSHLVGDHVRRKVRPVTLGKALSLVCRNLRPIGQALVWQTNYVDYAKSEGVLHKLLGNLEGLTHLHSHPIYLITGSTQGCSSSTFASITKLVLKTIQYCRQLVLIIFHTPLDQPQTLIRKIYDSASELKQLAHFVLTGESVVLDRSAVQNLWVGFPRLQTLRMSITVPRLLIKSIRDAGLNPPEGACRSGLNDLDLQVAKLVKPQGAKQLTCLLSLALGTQHLVRCRMSSLMFNDVVFQWLSFVFVNAQEVTFDVDLSDLSAEMPHLMTALPKLTGIVTFSINRDLSAEEHSHISVKSPVTLVKLLSSVPFSMHLFHVKGIYFFGSLSYPLTRLKSSALALIEGPSVQFFLKTSDSQTLTTLKKMKDKKGVLRWHRVAEVSALPPASSLPVVVAATELALTLSRSRFTALKSSSILPLSSSFTQLIVTPSRVASCTPQNEPSLKLRNEAIIPLELHSFATALCLCARVGRSMATSDGSTDRR